MKKLFMFAGSAFALVFGLFLAGCTQSASELAYATIEINPGIDMVLDENDNVQSATALNQDGEVLLLNLSLGNKKLDDAVNEIIDEAIDLGYIDPESDGTTVEITCTNEQTQEKLQERFNQGFQERGMFGRAIAKENQDLIAQAEELGVSVGFLRTVNRALQADDTLVFEDALQMAQQELVKIIQDKVAEQKEICAELRVQFQEDRQAILDEYLPQIQALEEQIAQVEAEEGDTTDLEAQLETLRTEMHDALTALRTEYMADGQAVREQIQNMHQTRIQEHEQAVEAFRNQIQERIRQNQEAIEQYQNHGTYTMPHQNGNQTTTVTTTAPDDTETTTGVDTSDTTAIPTTDTTTVPDTTQNPTATNDASSSGN